LPDRTRSAAVFPSLSQGIVAVSLAYKHKWRQKIFDVASSAAEKGDDRWISNT
jgi:hypothetical protein